MAAMASAKSRWHVLRIAVPGKPEGDGGVSISAIVIVEATDEEICPLRDVTGAGDAAGVGAKIVCLSEGGIMRDAGEDDEPDEQDGGGEENQAGSA